MVRPEQALRYLSSTEKWCPNDTIVRIAGQKCWFSYHLYLYWSAEIANPEPRIV
jgi:hypothetical protein